MIEKIDTFIVQFIRGNRHVIEVGKLTTIGLLALLSLFVSIYFLFFSPYTGFRFVYVFIPHLYLIPIILLTLWYPKSGLKLVIIILTLLFLFWFFADFLGYTFPPLFAILYTGIDLAIFVVFLLYVKDRRLIEAIILDILERNTEAEGQNSTIEHYNGDFDAIISGLGSKDETSREEAVIALSELHDTRAILPLITALRDESPHIRRCAAEALGHSQSSKVIRPLIEGLTDNDRYVRETAAEALGHLGKISSPDLIHNLSHKDWRVRVGALIALRISEDSPTTDQIIRALYDESKYVRREAAKTLGRIGDHRILPYLIEATSDPDPGVRLRSVRAVIKIGSQEEVLKVLQKCMQDSDSSVRILAGDELLRIKK